MVDCVCACSRFRAFVRSFVHRRVPSLAHSSIHSFLLSLSFILLSFCLLFSISRRYEQSHTYTFILHICARARVCVSIVPYTEKSKQLFFRVSMSACVYTASLCLCVHLVHVSVYRCVRVRVRVAVSVASYI